MEWRRNDSALIGAYRTALPFFRNIGSAFDELGDIDRVRLECLETLGPVLSVLMIIDKANKNPPSYVKSMTFLFRIQIFVSIRHEAIRGALVLIVEIRTTIDANATSNSQRNLWILSSFMLHNIFPSLRGRPRTGIEDRLNIAQISGESYDMLVKQCLATLNNSADLIRINTEQLNTLTTLIEEDGSAPLLNTIISHNVLARSTEILQYTWSLDSVGDTTLLQICRQHIVNLWQSIHEFSELQLDARSARLMLELKHVFLLERWSFEASTLALRKSI